MGLVLTRKGSGSLSSLPWPDTHKHSDRGLCWTRQSHGGSLSSPMPPADSCPPVGNTHSGLPMTEKQTSIVFSRCAFWGLGVTAAERGPHPFGCPFAFPCSGAPWTSCLRPLPRCLPAWAPPLHRSLPAGSPVPGHRASPVPAQRSVPALAPRKGARLEVKVPALRETSLNRRAEEQTEFNQRGGARAGRRRRAHRRLFLTSSGRL